MSGKYAKRISRDLKLGNCVPSCFQIRFRGLKGVLSVDPALDAVEDWSTSNGVAGNKLDILFRPSQDKFDAPEASSVEIVKFATPTPVCLNRPLISIMDQVSAMQGFRLHSRITGRVHALLDRQLMELAEMIMSEDKCRERLNELPKRIIVDKLSTAKGFALTQEPFFRSLLHASIKFTLQKQLMKEQIKIPASYGRSMFGVVDETGLLQYGQVYVQYTNNITLKTPGPNASKTVLRGRVLITKNPSIVAGDVRVFDAVDVPELKHLIDVVVFPQTGPRPHPDEMAGSDLDGDEYSVMWDPDLMFDYNHEPLDYTKDSHEPDEIANGDVLSAMRKFYVKYVEQDTIGAISNAFFANADLYGINSEVCFNIARKASQALDFPKTGLSPRPLVTEWNEDDDGKPLPPERAERCPDFMGKTHEPFYVSRRLAGQLFKRIRSVDNILALTMAAEGTMSVKLDIALVLEDNETYRIAADRDFSAYRAHMSALMDSYGIEDEGQLFSGCFTSLRNRVSDRDADDMSIFNTNYMIEQRVTKIFRLFRENFFVEFGGYEACTVSSDERIYGDVDECLRRYCPHASKEMMQKASAYYSVCYQAANKVSGKRFLSFPWLVWDILAEIRREHYLQSPSSMTLTIDPLSSSVSKFIDEYCLANEVALRNFTVHMLDSKKCLKSIQRYCSRFLGLNKLMFVLYKWAHAHGLFFDGRLNPYHLCLLLIQFGVGHLSSESSGSRGTILDRTDNFEQAQEAVDLNCLLGGLGRFFVLFLQFLSSRAFETLKYIDYSEPALGYSSKMLRGQWLDLHRAAMKTFYRIMLRSRFDELPLSNSTTSDAVEKVEMEPFVIELPESAPLGLEELEQKMLHYSGAEEIQLRRTSRMRVIVSARGTLNSLRRLRELVSVEPVIISQVGEEDMITRMNSLLYERIISIISLES